ncbi:MAG TPA: EAL domain-containing protein [Halothiobacillus sp.]|nr:EAL domain-containing protein [Halothiobacillus sp.]
MNQIHKNAVFSRYIWLIFLLYGILAAAFVVYVGAEKSIDQANEHRLLSVQLAEQLEQSSDNLTRMARAYTSTGKPIFKQNYEEILDTREGKAAPFADSDQDYGDLWLKDGTAQRPSTQPKSLAGEQKKALLDQMRAAHYTAQELALLTQSKQASDALTQLEHRAMAMVEQSPATDAAAHLAAIELLQSPAYYQAKAKIMAPIHEATELVLARTTQRVQAATQTALQLRWLFIILGVVLVALWLRAYQILERILGDKLDVIYQTISKIGAGDFSTRITIKKSQHNSVLDWLSRTQDCLAALNETRALQTAKIQRMTRLYAALSQCNQAIVRCTNQDELFAQICLDAVRFGGMKMAWIGRIDPESGQVKPLACHGDSLDYVEGIEVSIDPNKPSGNGPIGTALRTDQPFWSQDFQNDPHLAPWHERGKTAGWHAMASLPLHLEGRVFGSFSVYSDELNAFDEPAQNLLTEMAMDISFALDNFLRDTERRKAERERETALARLEKVTSHVPGLVYEFRLNADGSSCFPFASQGAARIYHVTPREIEFDASAVFKRIHPDDLAGVTASIQKSATALSPWRHEYRVLNPEGHAQWLLGQALPEREPNGATLWTGFITDISQQKETEARIAHLAHFDALTGLPNRVLLLEHFDYALMSAERDRTQLCLMFIDLDHFKNINDVLGHSTGDELLIGVANRFLTLLRPQDTLSRQGGDEFALLVPNCEADSATRLANRLIQAFNLPFEIANQELTITLSIGISVHPEDGRDFDSLSKQADIALYRAKEAGRNGYRFFTSEMQTHSNRVMQIDSALRKALANEQLQLVYQPQIDLKTQKIVGAEALLRWYHPELGQVSPAEFIPIAEENGLILTLGDWVLRTALTTAKPWLTIADADFLIAVNLSALQFRQAGLADCVLATLKDRDFPPQNLELELTERSTMENPESAIAMINTLNQFGIKFSIDDFGTGYSSLSYLKRFNLYKLKIDQSFVRDMTEDPEDHAIVRTIITMAQSLGLITIAEGVETKAQRDLLFELGCNESQGYFTGKPMPAEEFTQLLKLQNP